MNEHNHKTTADALSRRLDLVGCSYQAAAALALDIYTAFSRDAKTVDLEQFAERFVGRLAAWGLDDILLHQMIYATRLAEAEGPLLYEEMHKLMSLCDQIYALEKMGLSIDPAYRLLFETTLRRRFRSEQDKARLVARDKVSSWSRALWWYAEQLRLM